MKRLLRVTDGELRLRIKDLTAFYKGASNDHYRDHFGRDLAIAKELLRLRKAKKK